MISGPANVTVDAPLDTLPLYLRAGGIVVMLRSSIDTISPTEEPSRVDSFATDAGKLTVRIAPGADSEFAVYDGTRITQSTADGSHQIDFEAGSVFRQGFIVEVFGTAAPGAVSIDDVPTTKVADAAAVSATAGTHAFVSTPDPSR